MDEIRLLESRIEHAERKLYAIIKDMNDRINRIEDKFNTLENKTTIESTSWTQREEFDYTNR
jgi:nitrogen-specific signal transduction histidine kinase